MEDPKLYLHVERLKEGLISLAKSMLCVADSGYFDDGEAEREEAELVCIAKRFEHDAVLKSMKNMSLQMRLVDEKIDGIETLLSGRYKAGAVDWTSDLDDPAPK
ncbi:hypothetical protein BE20_05975 [Sorangium cellulosum]|uniref:Uncharacterized protein n=1 Tax=Sorangium cellulosum TaxID=56 RepID=A0A150SQC2_SORCE|nr:hypothetical protein BE18_06840 [Sorangium cellulosum]KYF94653.1 hypothetical protein BE20_05975 [Sorangium cellulosum]